MSQDDRPDDGPAELDSDPVVRGFVEHWGVMARSWGINATMGELFALLYITGADWTADDLRERLGRSVAQWVIALDPIDQSWEPRIVAVPESLRKP